MDFNMKTKTHIKKHQFKFLIFLLTLILFLSLLSFKIIDPELIGGTPPPMKLVNPNNHSTKP